MLSPLLYGGGQPLCLSESAGRPCDESRGRLGRLAASGPPLYGRDVSGVRMARRPFLEETDDLREVLGGEAVGAGGAGARDAALTGLFLHPPLRDAERFGDLRRAEEVGQHRDCSDTVTAVTCHSCPPFSLPGTT